jgi:hypothetical protein
MGADLKGGRVDSTALIFFLISPHDREGVNLPPLLVTTNKKFPHVLDKLSVEDNE